MHKISEKIGYIHGMMDGLQLNKDDETVKLLNMFVDVLDEFASSVIRMENDLQDLNDYVESIDDDLADIEMHYSDEDEFMDDDVDYDFSSERRSAKKKAPVSILRDADEDIDFDEDEYDDNDSPSDEFDDDIAETALFIGCVCPECGKFFSVCDPDSYDDDQKFECPFCKKHITLSPMDPSSVPTAMPVDD